MYGSNAEFTVFESLFLIFKPPQSNSDGWGGAPEASDRMISHSFSGLLNKLWKST